MRLLATMIGLCEAAATARGRRREKEGLAGGGRAEGAADRVVGGGRGASEERGEAATGLDWRCAGRITTGEDETKHRKGRIWGCDEGDLMGEGRGQRGDEKGDSQWGYRM
jgi:hypothetical protein